ncbi:MAG: hypothetical protein M1524_02535 [Patescibacteria group bacterium]|nr:hypothetical protein [Patescibacteria group bacterium]
MKNLLILVFVFSFFLFVPKVSAGFDQYGYNDTARNFVGTGSSWCQGKLGWDEAACDAYMGAWADDKLVMKWNAEWDRGNKEEWTDPNGYDAWINNEWNGRVDGSGEIWHYKIAWDKGCADGSTPANVAKGSAYCIWGPFAMLQSQGSGADRVHVWDVLLKPAGYGAY